MRRSAGADLVPHPTVATAVQAVRDGEVTGALVPMENSVEGGVPATLDDLAQGEPLVIVDEVVLAVSFALLVRPGTALADVRRIATHPMPRRSAVVGGGTLPDAVVLPALSTAGAAAGLAPGGAHHDAAIAPPSRPGTTASRCWPTTSAQRRGQDPVRAGRQPCPPPLRPVRTRPRCCSTCARTTPAR